MIVKATAHVKTPICLSSPLHFDALLTSIHPAMHNLSSRPTRYDVDSSSVIQAPLPLCSARSNDGDEYDWVWAATAAEFPDTAKIESDVIIKRWTAEDAESFRLVLSTATGSLRNRFIRFPIIVTPEVFFYCATSDVKELARILRRVKSLGGLRKSGYGVVSEWEIEEIDMDWQEILVKDGMARRRLPESFGLGESVSLSVKPPYWHKSTIVKGIDVGCQIELFDAVVIV